MYNSMCHNYVPTCIYICDALQQKVPKSAPTCVWFLETNQWLILEEGNKLAQLWSLSLLAKSINSYTQ